jgi:hypothetical protein
MTERARTIRACGTARGVILRIGWAAAGCGVIDNDAPGLIMNTQLDMDGQTHVRYSDLASTESSYALAHRRSQYFGRAILGPCEE